MDNSTDDKVVLEVKTESEARYQVARQWGVDPESLVVKVLDEEKAFFGLFGRKLRVEVRRGYSDEKDLSARAEPWKDGLLEDKDAEPVRVSASDMKNKGAVIRELLSLMDLDIEISQKEGSGVNLSGPDAAIAIGKHGDTIKALEYLANIMTRQESGSKIRLDSDGYRERRESSIRRLALSAAKEALSTGKTVYLDPMTSWERRIVHLALKDRRDVETHSLGADPNRKVAIRITNQSRKRQFQRRD